MGEQADGFVFLGRAANLFDAHSQKKRTTVARHKTKSGKRDSKLEQVRVGVNFNRHPRPLKGVYKGHGASPR